MSQGYRSGLGEWIERRFGIRFVWCMERDREILLDEAGDAFIFGASLSLLFGVFGCLWEWPAVLAGVAAFLIAYCISASWGLAMALIRSEFAGFTRFRRFACSCLVVILTIGLARASDLFSGTP